MNPFRLRPEKHNGESIDCTFRISPPAMCENCGRSFPVDYNANMIFHLYWCNRRHGIVWNDQMCFEHIERQK